MRVIVSKKINSSAKNSHLLLFSILIFNSRKKSSGTNTISRYLLVIDHIEILSKRGAVKNAKVVKNAKKPFFFICKDSKYTVRTPVILKRKDKNRIVYSMFMPVHWDIPESRYGRATGVENGYNPKSEKGLTTHVAYPEKVIWLPSI